MRPMAAKYSVSGKLFFVIYFIEGVTRNYTIYVYDSGSMKCIKQKKITVYRLPDERRGV